MEGIPHPIQFLSGDEPQDQLRMSIVTKKGDGGQTALRMGRKTSKAAWRVEAYGTVDELSAALGVARSFLSQDARFGDFASRILTVQNQLLSVGADLATRPEGDRTTPSTMKKSPADVVPVSPSGSNSTGLATARAE